MTYSIVARDPDTGELGVAVQSHWFSVGSIVTWAQPGVGAVATQANAEAAYGPGALALLADGVPAPDALERLVAAYPGGSPDVRSSRTRVEGFTATLRDKHGVEIVDSVDALLGKVDVVLLESVDGRKHLEQAEPVLKARKPVFIDKPVAGTLADALTIFQLAEASGTPCFSSSSLRYSPPFSVGWASRLLIWDHSGRSGGVTLSQD